MFIAYGTVEPGNIKQGEGGGGKTKQNTSKVWGLVSTLPLTWF